MNDNKGKVHMQLHVIWNNKYKITNSSSKENYWYVNNLLIVFHFLWSNVFFFNFNIFIIQKILLFNLNVSIFKTLKL